MLRYTWPNYVTDLLLHAGARQPYCKVFVVSYAHACHGTRPGSAAWLSTEYSATDSLSACADTLRWHRQLEARAGCAVAPQCVPSTCEAVEAGPTADCARSQFAKPC